jgi:hypothetical protein
MIKYKGIVLKINSILKIHIILFEFRPNLSLHFARSPSKHSDGYAFSADRPNCLAKFTLILEPFMHYVG